MVTTITRINEHPRFCCLIRDRPRAQIKKTTGATDGPKKVQWLLSRINLPVSCGQTGGRRRVDARFTLAVRTPAFGPLAFWTSVPSDACHYRHWSLSALVVIGTRHCWRGMARETTRSTERSNARRNRRFLNFLSGSRARAAPLGSSTSYARWDNGHEDNSPENGTCRTIAVVNLRQGSKWLVNWSLVREPYYADNSQSVSQKTGFSGWLKRKTGRVCRTRIFAASQSKHRLPHLGEFTSAFYKIVVTRIATDNPAVRVKLAASGPGPVQF